MRWVDATYQSPADLAFRGCWVSAGGGVTRDSSGVAAAPPWLSPHRLTLKKSRLLMKAARGFLGKPLTKTPESTPGSQSLDYVPLVSAPDAGCLAEGPSLEPPSRPPPNSQRKKTQTSPPRGQQGRGVCMRPPTQGLGTAKS